MRKIIGVAVSCLVACSLFLIVQPAFAVSYNGGWVPLQGVSGVEPTLTIQWSSDITYAFGIYDIDRDDGDSSIFTSADESMILASGNNVSTEGESVPITNVLTFTDIDASEGYDWWLYDSVTGGSVHLGDSDEFGFFFSESNSGSPTEFSYDVVQLTAPVTTYGLTWPEGDVDDCNQVHNITVMNAVWTNPPGPAVPIPTAMVLLSSGLVGLAGFKRKMDN